MFAVRAYQLIQIALNNPALELPTDVLRLNNKTADNIKIKCNYLKLGFDWLLKLHYYYITFVRTQTVFQETPILNNCINPRNVMCNLK